MSTTTTRPPAVHYPDSDGQPMADNTLQFEWIVTLQGNLDLMFREDANVFVAGDHLIYPVEGDADVRQAPDVYVAFGRPKGHRGSYKVFAEDGVFPQVVFEVWSPSNTAERMEEKRRFYERYGAEEYYILYPDFPAYFQGWRRDADALVRVANMHGYVSPRLGVRFEVARGHVAVFWPNGRPFLSYLELGALQQQTEARAEQERLRAEQEKQRAEQERFRAEQEKQRAERLAARLRELGVDPDAV
ncbi:MAG: Uma2 family endonuclease [Planctomycetes bacterium]|nr:Uma2 family endonuclease [Planctomycetota bacterium]